MMTSIVQASGTQVFALIVFFGRQAMAGSSHSEGGEEACVGLGLEASNNEFGTRHACYWIDTTQKSWDGAQAVCEGKGGRLATFFTQDIRNGVLANHFFQSASVTLNQRYWIGLKANNNGQYLLMPKPSAPAGTTSEVVGQLANSEGLNLPSTCAYAQKIGEAMVQFKTMECGGAMAQASGAGFFCMKDTNKAYYSHMTEKKWSDMGTRSSHDGVANSWFCGLKCLQDGLDCIGFQYETITKICHLMKPIDPADFSDYAMENLDDKVILAYKLKF